MAAPFGFAPDWVILPKEQGPSRAQAHLFALAAKPNRFGHFSQTAQIFSEDIVNYDNFVMFSHAAGAWRLCASKGLCKCSIKRIFISSAQDTRWHSAGSTSSKQGAQ